MTSELHFFNIWIDFTDGTGEGFPCLPFRAKTRNQAYKYALLFLANRKQRKGKELERVRIKPTEPQPVGILEPIGVKPDVFQVNGWRI